MTQAELAAATLTMRLQILRHLRRKPTISLPEYRVAVLLESQILDPSIKGFTDEGLANVRAAWEINSPITDLAKAMVNLSAAITLEEDQIYVM